MRTTLLTILFCLQYRTGQGFVLNSHRGGVVKRFLNDYSDGIPTEIKNAVLKSVYLDMVNFSRENGNPNIPLGSKEGRQCEQLRRLAVQGKLSEQEMELLQKMNFRFYSLEQVYETADFDELYGKLVKYRDENDGDVSPPKKYNKDPELGAWVTGIRRKGKDYLDPDHVKKLDAIQFDWVSPRGCGSQFMTQYRDLLRRKSQGEDIFQDEAARKWLRAQQEAAKRGTLSETRRHYMEALMQGKDWVTDKLPRQT
ncbi:hypothetical protein FisN_4Lh232 [Fistulifera solaris]|uniref:Helicase-associated domain-containing protein n=1 Tax=Fistulifera solaris TaxID=1519565 RepID=A0A1Z5KCW4_FISSO|nr:hypothetical protein FisN_4Lh232 [Fistulifera solaris]|eukprot:GAX24150.1 hypothetical protein FisN_4Lh232 [Fistulifera solaris]